MANNRMVLVCNVCKPKEWDYIDRKGILPIAKWYPGAPYSIDAYFIPEINKFLEEHSHTEVSSENYTAGAHQENPVRLEYESKGMPILNR